MAYKRKYRKGKPITSLDELVKQKFVYVNDRIYHIGWCMSWQVSMAKRYMDSGKLYYAEQNETEASK